jgi:hypothetical protein
LDSGEEKVEDETLAARLRKNAAEIHFVSLAAAVLLLILCYIFLFPKY